MPRTAGEIMQRHLITVAPDTPLLDVQRLFVEEEINGAPVVAEDGRLLGVISSADLLRAVEEERDTARSEARYFRDDLAFSGPDWSQVTEDFQDRLRELTVEDAMTRGGVCVAPEAPITEVARTLRQHRIHRVLVADGQRLVGLISTFDLVALLEKEGAA
jgi:CBS domain-containing protein